MVDNPDGSYIHKDPFNDTHLMCMKMKLPNTYSVTFDRKQFKQEVNWDVPIFNKEDPPKGLWSAYTSPCTGDSGSPQMLFAVKQKDPKFVLAAILSKHVGRFYNKTSDTFYHAPCGAHTENTEKKKPYLEAEDDIIKTIGFSVKITYGPIFQWIKTRSRTRPVP